MMIYIRMGTARYTTYSLKQVRCGDALYYTLVNAMS